MVASSTAPPARPAPLQRSGPDDGGGVGKAATKSFANLFKPNKADIDVSTEELPDVIRMPVASDLEPAGKPLPKEPEAAFSRSRSTRGSSFRPTGRSLRGLWRTRLAQTQRDGCLERAALQQASWTLALRALLPDSNGAPSAARREVLWQRIAVQQPDGAWDEHIPLPEMQAALERVVQQSGVVERKPLGEPTSRSILFLDFALRAAAEEVGVARRTFRLLLMRMHQYLDVHAVLPEVAEPHHRVRRESFERLLRERQHEMRLAPGGPVAPLHKIYEKLLNPGESEVQFDRLARWSMCAQHVRPGSGALAPQPRLADHWLDPSSLGIHGGTAARAAGARGRCGGGGRRRAAPPRSARGGGGGGGGGGRLTFEAVMEGDEQRRGEAAATRRTTAASARRCAAAKRSRHAHTSRACRRSPRRYGRPCRAHPRQSQGSKPRRSRRWRRRRRRRRRRLR